MKEFIKETHKIKKMKTGEIASVIYASQNEIIDFCIKEGHRAKNANIMKELYSRMLSEKFPKALNKIIKAAKKDKETEGLNIGFVTVIANFIERNHSNEAMTEDLVSAYSDIIDELLKKRVKKINKKVDISDTVIKELLLITPDIGYISNEKFVGIYSQKMLRKLYIMSQNNDTGLETIDQVTKMFKALFGKKLLDLIAINILLEKKEYMKNFNEKQISMWNLMSAFALDYINKEDKDHIIELLEYYCGRRQKDDKNGRDAARRINKSMITEDEYPRLAKAIAKFERKGKDSLVKYL